MSIIFFLGHAFGVETIALDLPLVFVNEVVLEESHGHWFIWYVWLHFDKTAELSIWYRDHMAHKT